MNTEDAEILQEYVEEAREHLALIEKGLLTIEEGGVEVDLEVVNKVFRAAHSIKGSVGNYRATKAFDGALNLETAARQGNLESCREIWPVLEPEMSRLMQSLEQFAAEGAVCES